MSNPFPPGTQLVAYLRDSGGADQDLSTEQQGAELKTWAESNGCIITRFFVDQAQSGTSTTGREAFKQMIDYLRSERRQEDGLLLWRHSRLARDIDDAQFYKADLRRHGIKIHAIKDPVPDGPIGRVIEAAIDWHNEQFSKDLGEDVKRGLQYILYEYGAAIGHAPVGFKRTPIKINNRRDGKEHILHRIDPDWNNPDLIARIRKAFELRALGVNHKEIHQQTQLLGTYQSYKWMFKNPIYIGRMVFGKRTGDPDIVENYCEPIIEEDLFDRIQKMYTTRSKHPRRLGSDFLLSGLLVCGKCGREMNGISSEGRYRYYYCYNSKRYKHKKNGVFCDCRYVPAEILERVVIEKLLDALNDPAMIDQTYEHMQKLQALATKDRSIEHRKKLLQQTRLKIANVTDAISEHGHSQALLDKLRALEKKQARLQLDIKAGSKETKPLSHNEVKQGIREIISGLGGENTKVLRPLVGSVIEKVEAYKSGSIKKIEVRIYIKANFLGYGEKQVVKG